MPRDPSDFMSSNTIAGVEGGIQDIVVIMEELRYQLHQERDLNKKLQAELSGASTRQTDLRDVAEAASRDLSRLSLEHDELRSESERLLTDITISSEERGETAKEIRRLREQLDASNTLIETREQEVERLNTAARELQMSAVGRARDAEEGIGKMRERVDTLSDQFQQRGRDLVEANSQVAALRDEKDRLESKIRALERARSDLDKVRTLMQAFALRTEDEQEY